ncbi:antibacterial peptide PMAP-23-like [Mesoplodon densirostris]|uniref:antibacterial peptide PMAP-23-like n=1 Tax=Mesoplodon densirostris TaxID=48708 RepID=UPI0028DC9C47|nr:antibacterial peptide PMAP-23-like [Mesoplodon densirostris]
METKRASLALGRWSLWLLLLGLVVPSASARALSYNEAVIRALDQLNERSSEANLYRLLELDAPPKTDEDPDTPKPVSFTVKETVCPRTTQQPPEQCDFKENGLVKQCVGTVTLDQVRGNFDIACNKVSGPSVLQGLLREGMGRGNRAKRSSTASPFSGPSRALHTPLPSSSNTQ